VTDAELKAAILEILQAKASSILQLARRSRQDVDRVQDTILDLERRGMAERVPLATPWRVTQSGIRHQQVAEHDALLADVERQAYADAHQWPKE
jgi:predicted transcriptional regulator